MQSTKRNISPKPRFETSASSKSFDVPRWPQKTTISTTNLLPRTDCNDVQQAIAHCEPLASAGQLQAPASVLPVGRSNQFTLVNPEQQETVANPLDPFSRTLPSALASTTEAQGLHSALPDWVPLACVAKWPFQVVRGEQAM